MISPDEKASLIIELLHQGFLFVSVQMRRLLNLLEASRLDVATARSRLVALVDSLDAELQEARYGSGIFLAHRILQEANSCLVALVDSLDAELQEARFGNGIALAQILEEAQRSEKEERSADPAYGIQSTDKMASAIGAHAVLEKYARKAGKKISSLNVADLDGLTSDERATLRGQVNRLYQIVDCSQMGGIKDYRFLKEHAGDGKDAERLAKMTNDERASLYLWMRMLDVIHEGSYAIETTFLHPEDDDWA